MWYREVMWFGRNPAENAARVLLGVADRNYAVEITRHDGTAPNGDLIGWEIGRLIFSDGRTLPWISYQGQKQKFYWDGSRRGAAQCWSTVAPGGGRGRWSSPPASHLSLVASSASSGARILKSIRHQRTIEEVAMDAWGFLSVVAVCVTIALAPLVWSRIK
jgi:hypothetical protein